MLLQLPMGQPPPNYGAMSSSSYAHPLPGSSLSPGAAAARLAPPLPSFPLLTLDYSRTTMLLLAKLNLLPSRSPVPTLLRLSLPLLMRPSTPPLPISSAMGRLRNAAVVGGREGDVADVD